MTTSIEQDVTGKLCKGCGKSRPDVGLKASGYHYYCEPCKGCGQIRPRVGLLSSGYHADCVPCKGCELCKSSVFSAVPTLPLPVPAGDGYGWPVGLSLCCYY